MIHTTLVDTETLAAHINDRSWVVFDCRHDLAQTEAGLQAYRQSHIPGAHFAHCDRDLAGERTGVNGRHPLPEPRRFAEFLTCAGTQKDTQIVAYDAQGGMFAARLWWLARWLGHQAVTVLDGGWNLWQTQGRPASSAMPENVRGNFNIERVDAWVDARYVARPPGPMVLLDARAPDRFRGENETLDPVAGHIPGARNRFFRDNLAADGRFKEARLLRDEFNQYLGSSSPAATVHSCGSGVSACHNLLAMEIAGLQGSKLYAGSWSEWCADPARPVATGPG